MKKIYISIILSISICISVSAQDITFNDDGSISVEAKGKAIFKDAEGRTIPENVLNDSLATGQYNAKFSLDGDDTVLSLVRNRPTDIKEVIGKKLSPLEYNDIEEEEITIIDGQHPFLICFWDRYCGSCIEEIEILDMISNEFSDLRIIAITPDKKSDILDLMDRHNYKWDKVSVVTDYKGEYDSITKSTVHPTTILVGEDGIIEKIYFGRKIRQIIADADAFLRQGMAEK